MATVKNTTVSRFHNLSDEALADAIGRADAIVKGAEAELATLEDEFKARGLSNVAGDCDGVRTDLGPDRRQWNHNPRPDLSQGTARRSVMSLIQNRKRGNRKEKAAAKA
jgi:hypothetical protein